MKKLFFTLALAFTLCSHLSAQVTKIEIEKMITEAGATSAAIKTIYVGNTVTFYTDGTSRRTYATYTSPTDDGGDNKLVLTDSGVKIVYSKGGKIISSILLPYNNIATVEVDAVSINVYMRD